MLVSLSGLASTGVQKLVGDGLYIKKGGCVCEVEVDGRGLYLEPTSGKGLSYIMIYLKMGVICGFCSLNNRGARAL